MGWTTGFLWYMFVYVLVGVTSVSLWYVCLVRFFALLRQLTVQDIYRLVQTTLYYTRG